MKEETHEIIDVFLNKFRDEKLHLDYDKEKELQGPLIIYSFRN